MNTLSPAEVGLGGDSTQSTNQERPSSSCTGMHGYEFRCGKWNFKKKWQLQLCLYKENIYLQSTSIFVLKEINVLEKSVITTIFWICSGWNTLALTLVYVLTHRQIPYLSLLLKSPKLTFLKCRMGLMVLISEIMCEHHRSSCDAFVQGQLAGREGQGETVIDGS